MAKELPYFKFEPNQWENGNIQICTREEKGLFIDLCSMYWSRLGDLSYKLALQKLCNGNATALQSLCDENIIEVIEGNIFIKFLSEQLSGFEDVSEQNSQNAKKRWEKYRKQKELTERNATVLQPQSERNAIREEEIKEDNTTKSEVTFNHSNIDEFKQQLATNLHEHQQWLDSCYMTLGLRKNTISDLIDKYKQHLIGFNLPTKKDMQDFKTHFRSWLLKEKRNNNLNDYLKR